MARRLGITLMLAVALLASAGCSGSASKPAAGGSAGGSAEASAPNAASPSAESTTAQAGPYAALTPESANEKKAVASIDTALKMYAQGQKMSNKQNNSNNYVFANEKGYKPLFIGYQVNLLTGKQANGKYGYAQVLVLGDKVTTMSQWESAVGATRDNGMLNMKYFKLEAPSDPLQFTKTFAPSSAGETNAVKLATDWMATNAADLGFKEAKLTGYVFVWGQPGDHPNLLLAITPDGGSYTGTGTAP